MAAPAHIMPTTLWCYPALLLATHDGDSFHLRISLSWKDYFEGQIRLARVNCPEVGKPGGAEATDFTNAWLDEAARRVTELPVRERVYPLIVQSRIEDNHSRPLCEVWRKCDQANLSDALMLSGNAHLYALLMAV